MSQTRIFTVASDVSKMAGLYESMRLNGVNKSTIEVLEVTNWRGFIDKILMMKHCVESLPDDTIVCFIDAYDVLCFADIQEIETKFKEYGCDIVFSSELNCYPIENQERYDFIEYSLFEQHEEGLDVCPIQTNYKYLNSGGYIGYAGAMKRLFTWKTEEEMARIIELGGDQNYFTQYYLEYGANTDPKMGPRVCVDAHQRIFQSLYKVDLADFAFFRGRFYNHVLSTYPCFVHFNGYKDYGWQLKNRDTGKMRNAMDVFLDHIGTSIQLGCVAMDYHLVPFYYAGAPQECIAQKKWGDFIPNRLLRN
jgi:hypothetical protein